jgi:electron transfer flavoprotein beta subunit
MNIITCIKQVPASSDVKVDPETGVLLRDSKAVKMNPYDLYGLEMAYQIKDHYEEVNVHAITMGPPSAKDVLYESLYMGADKATLVTDRKFAGADVLATSYTLSQLIKHIHDFDLVICGKQTTDGDTAQVGPEIAEFLGIPHIPYVKKILDIKKHSIIVLSDYDAFEETVEVKLPCLITVDKIIDEPRLPSYLRKIEHQNDKINLVTLKNLKDSDENHYGLKGSPTQVEEIFPPEKNKQSKIIKGKPTQLAEALIGILGENKYI